jgi:gliding motility-associated-like protein
MFRFVNYLILILYSNLFFYSSDAWSQNYVFAQLNGSPIVNTSGWNLTGNAFTGDTPGDADNLLNELVLTSNTTWQSGAIFYNSPINLQVCTKWTVEFDFRIFGGNGADGMAFCFLDVPPSGFVNGGGMGIPGTANGLKIGLDTYNNCGGPNPELQIYSGSGYDECIAGMVKVDNSAGNLNFVRNNNYQPARITYNNGVIQFFINNTLYLTANFNVNFSGYMGFTASSGSLYDQHSIRNVIIYTEQAASNAGPNLSMCSGDTVTIGTTPNNQYVYNWTPINGLSANNISNPSVTLVNNTSNPLTQNFSVSTSLATNPGVCPTSDQVTVTVFPNLSTTIYDTVCDGGPYLFNGQILSNSGTYISNLQTLNGCDSTVTLNLIISNPPNLLITDTAFCRGGIAELNPSGALSYQWTPSVGTVNPNGLLTVIPNQNLSLLLVGLNAFNCADSQSVQITVYDNPVMQLVASDLAICPGEVINLTVTGANTYSWNGGELSGLTGDNQSFIPSQTATYTVVGENLYGCTDTADLQIVVNPAPFVSTSPDTAICLGEEVVLNAFGAQTYIWNDGTNGSSNMTSPLNSAVYQVIGSNNFGCSDTASLNVTVHPLPEAIIQVNPTMVYSDNPTVQFSNNSIGASFSVWNFDNGELLETSATSFDYTYAQQEGNYLATLTVSNQFGCTDFSFVPIEVIGDIIYYIPNTFTPDGDEFNNVFLPVFSSGFDPYNYILTIYNRWGEVVYESKDYLIGWDGDYNGQLCPTGIYTYAITYKAIGTDFKKTITGHVELLR